MLALKPVTEDRGRLMVQAQAIPPVRLLAPRGATGSGPDGALTLSGAPFQGTWAWSVAEDDSTDYNSTGAAIDFHAGLFPVRSPLLGESW